jgi:hypothetical protein
VEDLAVPNKCLRGGGGVFLELKLTHAPSLDETFCVIVPLLAQVGSAFHDCD